MLPQIPAGPQTRSPDSGVWCWFFCLSNRSRLLLFYFAETRAKTTSITNRRTPVGPAQVLQVAEELERLSDGFLPPWRSHWLEHLSRLEPRVVVLFCGRWSPLK